MSIDRTPLMSDPNFPNFCCLQREVLGDIMSPFNFVRRSRAEDIVHERQSS